MSMPAWKIATLPRVPSPLAQWSKTIRKLRPLGTSILFEGDSPRLRQGQQVWGFESDGSMLGIAWDWKELMPGVVVMGDPMSIVTNATFVDEEGSPVDDAVRVLCVNAAVYQLPWQRGVRSAVQGRCVEAAA